MAEKDTKSEMVEEKNPPPSKEDKDEEEEEGSTLSMALWFSYPFAFLLRHWLMRSGLFCLTERPELASPLNSYKRLQEGVHLYGQGVDPYSGVLFHETPLTLHLFGAIFDLVPDNGIHFLFIFCDILTASMLGKVAQKFARNLLQEQSRNCSDYHEDAAELLLDAKSVQRSQHFVQIAYLLNPYIVANCAAKTTTVFSNLFLALILWAAMSKRPVLASILVAFSTYQTFYPLQLVVPLILFSSSHTETIGPKVVAKIIVPFLATFTFVNWISYEVMGKSWNFLLATHGFILNVPELSPNMGLFWYFFTEMFEHFRVFFVCTFQLNCFLYVYPLAARLRHQPYILTLSLIALMAIFKSYPTYGDVGFYLALLPTVGYLFPYMKQTFIVANMFVATTILGPIVYQLWIYNGSANANYFFAINLVFGSAQIFLVTDILFAHVKREFYLRSGFKALKPSGDAKKDAKIMLQ